MHERLLTFSLLSSLCFSSWLTAPAASAPLRSLAEQSGFIRTGRYDEVEQLCTGFARAAPQRIRCLRFGTSPEGRPLQALAVSADGVLDAATAKQRARPVVLMQGGIHAGEIDGKDASFLLLQKWLASPRPPRLEALLSRLTLLLVPVFNVDGHERFGPNHRPNQNGPAAMGFRTTAQNLNLNRDYVKAESPEMAAMLRLLQEWDPLLYVDLHVTDGAEFQPDVSVQLEPRLGGAKVLQPLGAQMSAQVMAALRAGGHLPLDFYPSFEKLDDPASGFSAGVAPPRFSHGYWPLHNRFAALVETHSYKDYRHRVHTTLDAMLALLEQIAARGPELLGAVARADAEDAALGGSAVPLAYDHGPRTTRMAFPGYVYTQELSPVSGTLRVRYDARRPQTWDIPFYGDVAVTHAATAPRAGYLIPPAYAALFADKLRLHGLTYRVLSAPVPPGPVEVFRASSRRFRAEPYEGRQTVEVEGSWRPEQLALPAGSLFVPVGQRGGRLVVQLLEPGAPDSLLAWGFLNAIFEKKEYIEDYLTESIAETMLQRDAALKAEFIARLRSDAAFARDPSARLRFFSDRHPARDERQDRYPIYRLATPPPGAPMTATAPH